VKSNYEELYEAARRGNGQDLLDLLIHVKFENVNDDQKLAAGLLVWRRNAEINGHPRTSLLAARLFMKVGRYDLDKACLKALSFYDIAPAVHLLAAYHYQEGNLAEAIKLAKRSGDLNYDLGKSLYYLARSKRASFLTKYYLWLKSRLYYKVAGFWVIRKEAHDFSQVWFGDEFDYADWLSTDHSERLLAALDATVISEPSKGSA
jgi:hypothetical protein